MPHAIKTMQVYMQRRIHPCITYLNTFIYVLCRDFFQEMQSYLLTEFPLSKYEGGQPFDPFPTIWWGARSMVIRSVLRTWRIDYEFYHILKGHYSLMISTKYYFDWSKSLY